jgi:hypothetical protein
MPLGNADRVGGAGIVRAQIFSHAPTELSCSSHDPWEWEKWGCLPLEWEVLASQPNADSAHWQSTKTERPKQSSAARAGM